MPEKRSIQSDADGIVAFFKSPKGLIVGGIVLVAFIGTALGGSFLQWW